MLHSSVIELDRKALKNNIDFIRKTIGDGVKYSMVVKANAYGHGIEEMVPEVQNCGVNHFSVFSIAEAMRVFGSKNQPCEIMIMGWLDGRHMEWVIRNNVSFFVFTTERLLYAIETAKRLELKAKINLELETGMYRTGFREEELHYVAQTIVENQQYIEVEGLCTHYAGAESLENNDRVMEQISAFTTLHEVLKKEGIKPKYCHTACSAATFNYPETIMDMVRIGVSTYGYWPNAETKVRYQIEHQIDDDPLKRILSWKSSIMSVNLVPEGKFISYGKSYLTARESKIATVPVGYGYGFSRTLSNNGHVLVNGERAAVIGTVNMNMVVIDVTDIPEVSVGDEVVLIGFQGEKEITVSSFSDMNNSLNYEMLARLPDHIPRVVV